MELSFPLCQLCRLEGVSGVFPLSLCSCFLLFTPGNMLCIADILLVFLHTYTSSSLCYKSQRSRVFLLSKKQEFRLNYFPSFPTGNSHLINGFPRFPCLFQKTDQKDYTFRMTFACCFVLCFVCWKYNSRFPFLFSTGALHSRVQVQGECVWELLRYVFVHAISADPVWPLLVYRYQPWRPDHEGQQGKKDQRSCALPAKSHWGFVSSVLFKQTFTSINAK